VDGGGIDLVSGNFKITNGTVTNNRSDADASGGGSGGGLNVAGGTPTLQNTIVAANFTGTGSTASDIAGTVSGSSSLK
jgi:hypothetical protein